VWCSCGVYASQESLVGGSANRRSAGEPGQRKGEVHGVRANNLGNLISPVSPSSPQFPSSPPQFDKAHNLRNAMGEPRTARSR